MVGVTPRGDIGRVQRAGRRLADGDQVIQIGVVHTDNPEEYRRRSAERRKRIAAAVAPFVASVELDTSYDLIEELVPIHA